MELYNLSLKSHRRKIAKLVKENEQAYNSLEDKGTMYAMQIKALGDLHRKVRDIYKNAPDEIKNPLAN